MSRDVKSPDCPSPPSAPPDPHPAQFAEGSPETKEEPLGSRQSDSSGSSEVSGCTAILRPASREGEDGEEESGSAADKIRSDPQVILSAQKLLPLQEKCDSSTTADLPQLLEIDLNQPEQVGPAESGQDSSCKSEMLNTNEAIQTHEIQSNTGLSKTQTGTGRGFGESQARLCVTSKRLRDYLESLRPAKGLSKSSGDRLHFYQFFKSIRTELVASLLFTLITSQALISCRSNLAPPPAPNNRLGAQVFFGVVSCITVATLMQVFGPVSGCHLIPANSLAIYLKGHISRFRLASYLFAQSAGALLAIALLTLLTSSQLTNTELAGYNQVIQHHMHPLASLQGNESNGSGRRKRQADNNNLDQELTSAGESGSTILLSIMEQQDEWRRRRAAQLAGQPEGASREETVQLEGPGQKTINDPGAATNKGTYQDGSYPGLANKKKPLEGSSAADEQQKQLKGLVAPLSGAPPEAADNRPGGGSSQPPPPSLRQQEVQLGLSGTRSLNDIAANAETSQPNSQVKLRRRRSKPRKAPASSSSSNGTSNESLDGSSRLVRDNKPESGGGGGELELGENNERFINLLGLALPEPVMASESVRQCRRGLNSSSTRLAFDQCLSLSNPSQMFIFQFLASLLVVLTHLVNVDPRRTDLGFKSLSIGLSYFVASVLTLQSGGFYGNPSQVLFLSLFATSGQWQTEWLVYLAAPLVAGLFGAMSHEYIDFTSLRNRNKELHLRRSFYSLEELNSAPARPTDFRESSGCAELFPKRLSSASSESVASGITLTSEHHQPNYIQDRTCPDRGCEDEPASSRKAGCSYARQLRLEHKRMVQAEAGQLAGRKRCDLELAIRQQDLQAAHTFHQSVRANFLVGSPCSGSPTRNFVEKQRQGNPQNGFAPAERLSVGLMM